MIIEGGLMKAFFVSLLASGLLFSFAPAEAQSPQEVLDRINKLPAAERQEALIGGAKKERELNWTGAMDNKRAAELVKGFTGRYPFLQVRFHNVRATNILDTLLTENRAGKVGADMINTRSSFYRFMVKERAVLRYKSPQREFLRKGFANEEGYWSGIYAQARVFLVNTKSLPLTEAPRSIEDLVDPRWKGKLGLEAQDYDWLAALIEYYGEQRAKEIAGRLAKQEIQLRRGVTLLSQLVVAGEFPVQIDAFPEEAFNLKSSGAPVDYVFPEPFVPVKSPTALYIPARSNHPHAAALMVDFLLSKEGQEIMARQGRWVSRTDVKSKIDAGDKNMLVVSPDWEGARSDELMKLFNSYFLRRAR
jgi:iron(III) transport system substrate-binding protein